MREFKECQRLALLLRRSTLGGRQFVGAGFKPALATLQVLSLANTS